MGIKINALPAKTDKVSDNDLLVIEDSQDTKKITVKEARSALAVMSDEKLEIIKEEVGEKKDMSNDVDWVFIPRSELKWYDEKIPCEIEFKIEAK